MFTHSAKGEWQRGKEGERESYKRFLERPDGTQGLTRLHTNECVPLHSILE